MDRLLKCEEVLTIFGISRSTLDRMEKRGQLPKRVRLSISRVGWWESSIQEHQEKLKRETQQPALPAGKTWRSKTKQEIS